MSNLKKRPLIGISAVASFDEKMHSQRVTYANAIWAAGGEAILLPCNPDKSNCANVVAVLDGLLAPGGYDIDPQFYGEEILPVCGKFVRYEDEYDMALIEAAVKQGKPVLGICRGMQVINALYGGTLYQDIKSQHSDALVHEKVDPDKETMHTVTIDEASYLAKIFGQTEGVAVNSSHHQAVKDIAPGFKVTAKACDGTIEAMENEDHSVLCVQWHPERLGYLEGHRKLIEDFVERCR